MRNTVITGTGSYIPTSRIKNEDYLDSEFFDARGEKINKTNREIIKKFEDITCIKERRYVTDDLRASDIAFEAAKQALEGVDRESLDYILVAHNFGDIQSGGVRIDFCPSLASRLMPSRTSRWP